ncbi:MAG TPA: EscU/YscU/HrcU family type III secretion system export apparatus switch protein [Acidimicrobiales bacterium]|nr:EscU/YscU/HrcU family type III secretion system export apparatus switch protein [Acidimicrobiales bacterium]
MSGEKTEKPTPKRKREARRDGRIPKSQDLVAWTSLLAATLAIGWTVRLATGSFRDLFTRIGAAAARPDEAAMTTLLGAAGRAGLVALAPLAGVLLVVGLTGNVAQTGLAVSGKALKPKWSRVSPFSGFKRLLSPASVWEGLKSLLKLVLMAFLTWRHVKAAIPTLFGSGLAPVQEVAGTTARLIFVLARDVCAAGLALAAVDYGMQRRRVNKGLLMSKQEIKEEARQSEGDPHVKGAIRERQRRMSRMRMMADVAKADVVIVNPVHIAVALRYDPARGAPRVVAKGAGTVAARIRAEAEKKDVPIVRDIPLARAIHKVCDLGDEIPADLYEAVARVLAFVFSLRASGMPVFGPVPTPQLAR